MSRSKTHRGVEMRSTFGMKADQKSKTWLVVMNRAQARVFKWDRDAQDLITVKSWKFPEGKKKGSELISDQPGRVFNSKTFSRGGHQTGAPRHSYSTKKKPEIHLAEKAVKNVIDWVEKNKTREKVTDLVCVAEPRLMGIMQKQMKKKGTNPIQKRWEKDFGWLGENEVRERLLTWLAGRRSTKKRFLPRPSGDFGVQKGFGAYAT